MIFWLHQPSLYTEQNEIMVIFIFYFHCIQIEAYFDISQKTKINKERTEMKESESDKINYKETITHKIHFHCGFFALFSFPWVIKSQRFF